MGIFGPPDVKKLAAAKDVKGLIKALNYKDMWIAKDAAKALGPLKDPRAVEPLIAALSVSALCSDAIGALGIIRDSRAVEPLLKILLKDEPQGSTVTQALGRLGPPAVDGLIKALSSEHENVRWRATDALGDIGDPRAIDALIQAGSDKSGFVSASAKRALKKISGHAIDPLLKTIADGDVAQARTLLDAGMDVNASAADGMTPLWKALYRRSSDEMMALLLDKGADVALAERELGRSPLHWAASENRSPLVALLLDKGAKIEALDKAGDTALHCAAYDGATDSATLLLNKGADVNARGKQQRTPLFKAIEHGHTDVAALLINRNADVNVKDSNGKTPLSETGWFGRAAIAALLLDKGAMVNAKDVWENTPLKRANEFNHPDVAALLKKHGAVE
jgi:ankyrin repeat protein